MDTQIDEFYQDACKALLQLYRVFPRQSSVYVDELIGFQELDEFGLPHERHQRCLGTLLWLGDEGYLRHTGLIMHEALDQAVLTEKGLLRLTVRPSTASLLDAGLPGDLYGRTLAQLLRDALRTGDDERLSALARLVFLPLPAPARDTV